MSGRALVSLAGLERRRGGRRRIAGMAAVLGLLTAAPAEAHLVQTGFGKFYDGAAHFFLTPADWLLVLALALLAGLRGAAAGRALLLALPAGWLAGGLLGAGAPGQAAAAPWLTAIPFALAGVLAAADARLPVPGVAVLGSLAGVVHGYVNGSTILPAGGNWLSLAGVAVTAFVAVTLVAAGVSGLRAAWARVAVRVAGSWIAAIGLLMIGWLLRPAGG